MANLLRMDFYRLIKGKMLWIFLGIVVVIVAVLTGIFGFVNTDAGREFMMNAAQGSGTVVVGVGNTSSFNTGEVEMEAVLSTMFDISQIQYVNQSFTSGGALLILLFLLVALFVAVEFESGFAKNVFSVRQNKLGFFVSKLIVMLVVTVVFLLFGTVLSMLGSVLIGLDLIASSPAEWAVWFGATLLVIFAYELIVAALVWTTRNKVAGVVLAVLFAAGLIGGLLAQGLGFFFPNTEVIHSLLYTSLQATSTGTEGIEALGLTTILVVGALYAVIAGAAGLLALKKRDV